MEEHHLLETCDLKVRFRAHKGYIYAVRGVNFHVDAGETLALVGESGSGKSVTVKAILKLLPSKVTEIYGGIVKYKGEDLTAMDETHIRKYRGREISMIFQDPMTSLNPTTRIGKQIAEGMRLHLGISRKEANKRVQEMLKRVGIFQPRMVAKAFPHQLSGGMRQRVMIAIALACNPDLLFADEPTTALDVTIQAQIMELIGKLQTDLNLTVILITHDLGVIADYAHRIAVMYAGSIVEQGTKEEIFYSAKHPYTCGLLEAIPRLDMESQKKLVTIEGMPPQLRELPVGCPFAPRCKYAMQICLQEKPATIHLTESHSVACWLTHQYAPAKAAFENGGSKNV